MQRSGGIDGQTGRRATTATQARPVSLLSRAELARWHYGPSEYIV
jgi:hypothetical protein